MTQIVSDRSIVSNKFSMLVYSSRENTVLQLNSLCHAIFTPADTKKRKV